MRKNQKNKGFTLLEVLLVVAIITILAGIVILALNIGKQLSATRNAERMMEVNAILNATYQYSLDNDGNIPATITATPTEICKTGATSCSGLIDLSVLTANEEYLVSLPVDPRATNVNGTGYTIAKTAYDRIIVAAPNAERETTISVIR